MLDLSTPVIWHVCSQLHTQQTLWSTSKNIPVQNPFKRPCFAPNASLLTPSCLLTTQAQGFTLKIPCSAPELEVILLKHLVMTQAPYQMHITCDSLPGGWTVPGKLDFVYFQTVPYIYIRPGCDDTSAWWKCFQCFLPQFKGLRGKLQQSCDTGSTLGLSSLLSPVPPTPPSPCYPDPPQIAGSVT